MIDTRIVPPLTKLSSSISAKSTCSELNSFRTDDSRAHYTSAALYRTDWHFHHHQQQPQQDDLVTPCQSRKRLDFCTNVPPPLAATAEIVGAPTTHVNEARLLSDFCNWTANSSSSQSSPLSSYEGGGVPPPPIPLPTGGNKKTQYHKTKMCPWHREGKCFMGTACNYAHSREELRPKPDLSKTKLCPEVMKGRPCTRNCCRFAHDFVELRATAAFFKTRLCKYYQRGHCPAGDDCRHAHGREEVRAPAIPPKEPVSGFTDTTAASSSRSGFNSSSGSFVSSSTTSPPHGGGKMSSKRGADIVNSSRNVVPPAASQLPSPSFLSTSAASTPSPNGRRQGLPSLQQCAALLNGGGRGGDEGALNLLKSWISQEVERQVQIRQQATESVVTEADETCFLPADVLQGLNTTTPAHGRGGWLTAARSPDATTTSGASPATFAAAVQSMVTSTTTCDDRTPTHLLLKTLGDLSASAGWSAPSIIQEKDLPSFPPMHNTSY